MIQSPPYGLVPRDLNHIGTSLPWFREQLAAHGVELRGSPSLALGLRRLEDFRNGALNGRTWKFGDATSSYLYFAEAIGADFLTKSIHAGADAGFELPEQRWKFLASGDPLVTRPGRTSMERNLTWETVIAGLAATFSTNVEFAEPDVLCEFSGKRFAIAAKIGYSSEKLVENIKDGFKQANGKADACLVFVNVGSLYPQVETFELSHAWRSRSTDWVVRAMSDSVARWCAKELPIGALEARVHASSVQPVGVAFFFPLLLSHGGNPVPFWYLHMPVAWTGPSGPDYEFARAFLVACNNILGFLPKTDALVSEGGCS